MHDRYATARIRQEVQQLLRRDGAQHGPTKPLLSSLAPPPVGPAFLTTTSMPYTLAVFNEALRLYPPIPFEIRQAQAPTTLPDGTFLPKDSIVVWCLWAANRSRLTWGEDAELFRPGRWLTSEAPADADVVAVADCAADGGDGGARVRLVQKSPSEFPVFNGGPRACMGRKMAELIAVQVIASVVWAFELVPAYEGTERSSKSSLTLPMEGGLPVLVKTRSRVGLGDDVDHEGLALKSGPSSAIA